MPAINAVVYCRERGGCIRTYLVRLKVFLLVYGAFYPG